MAIIYKAELSPTKPEVLRTLLTSRAWGSEAEQTILGAYRFDDPAGEVGVECHLVRAGESIYHLPLTYRPSPLDGEDAPEPVLTMEHSVLGTRYVYDGLEDEVALECFARALAGEQQQAELDIYEGDTVVDHRRQTVTLRLEVDEGEQAPSSTVLLEDGEPFTIARTLGDLDGTVRLVAAWDGGEGVVAAV